MDFILEQVESPPAKSSRLIQLYQSSLGKKLISGVTGLGLVLFVTVHLAGNLTLLAGHRAFNQYARHLEELRPWLGIVELLLLVAVLVHGTVGVHIYWQKRQARPQGYERYTSAGAPSLQSLSSRNMIVTGLVLAGFLGLHLAHFKFGPTYPVEIDGVVTRDLARLVVDTFQRPGYTFGYVGVMVGLGLHLRHGVWSAFQSLGAMGMGIRSTAYTLGTGLALLLAVGFLGLPLAIYFGLVT
ncbi:succinate dehydrogenase cytochrome b subunit [Halomicronema hongdechloris]|nr:succinate dehydrogenase cytochrome b subunit [Halomicronema hongdechloris]